MDWLERMNGADSYIEENLTYDIDYNTAAHEKINTKTKLENTGLSVRYPTFEDKILSTVQRYVLESELLQMIGRARLVNYPECRVLLFSRYPLQDSEVVIYKDKATKEYQTLIK